MNFQHLKKSSEGFEYIVHILSCIILQDTHRFIPRATKFAKNTATLLYIVLPLGIPFQLMHDQEREFKYVFS